MNYKQLAIEYDKVISFFKDNDIKYYSNPLLKGKELFKADKTNRILKKIFFTLDKIKLGKISMFLYNRVIK